MASLAGLNDLLKLIEQAFKLRHLRFYLRELGPRGLADHTPSEQAAVSVGLPAPVGRQ